MDRKVAEEIVLEYLKFGEIFNHITELSLLVSEENLAKTIRRSVGEAQAVLYEGLIGSVKRIYPDLEPSDDPDAQ